jgi:hypothetical protein
MFPVSPRSDASDVLAMAGMDTLELVSRLQRSDLDQACGSWLTGSALSTRSCLPTSSSWRAGRGFAASQPCKGRVPQVSEQVREETGNLHKHHAPCSVCGEMPGALRPE